MRGRFAPSPTGALHVGNLRTALASWLQTQSAGGDWLVRMEDLDRLTSSRLHEASQLADLAALGMHSDWPVLRQSERFALYHDAIATLQHTGRVYECYCSRREIREAAQAPHQGHGQPVDGDAYPGTCRQLSLARLAELQAAGRPPALRLRSEGERFEIDDLIAGHYKGTADDVVIQRNDRVPAYNLAVVVDDAAQGITHVTRGGDLLASVPSQRFLQRLLQVPEPRYAHVPLVIGADGTRLAKRHGAVTLSDLAAKGVSAQQLLRLLIESLAVADSQQGNKQGKREDGHTFRIEDVARQSWTCPPPELVDLG